MQWTNVIGRSGPKYNHGGDRARGTTTLLGASGAPALAGKGALASQRCTRFRLVDTRCAADRCAVSGGEGPADPFTGPEFGAGDFGFSKLLGGLSPE